MFGAIAKIRSRLTLKLAATVIKRPSPMNRLNIFYCAAALTGVWLYLILKQSRSPIPKPNWIKPDEAQLKGCFPWSIYYLQSLEYEDRAVICRGNLRSSSDIAYRVINDKVKEVFGDRFLVLLQEVPIDNSENDLANDLNHEPEEIKSIFAIVPNFNPQNPFAPIAPKLEWLLWISSILIGLLPLGLYGWGRIDWLLEVGLVLGVVLILRELARSWVAHRYNLKTSLPFFAPHFGGIVWYKSHIPNRRVLFDLAIAPSLVSFAIGITLVIVGILQPTTGAELSLLKFDFGASLLMSGLMSGLISGIDQSARTDLNFLAYAGWWCLNLTALSLIPVGILDGACVVSSMFGSKKTAIATPIMRMTALGLGLVSQQWLIVVAMELFLLDSPQPCPLDDVTQLNLGREVLGIVVLSLAVSVILPLANAWKT